jgi:hypothetical protein
MKSVFTTVRLPAIVSSILVLSFMILELINRQDFQAREGFPLALFAVLWLLPVVFLLIPVPTARKMRAGTRSGMHSVSLLLNTAAMILIAWLWVSAIHDQMPCFLGIPNCD